MGTPSVKAIEQVAEKEQSEGTNEIMVINPEQWDFDPGSESASLHMTTVTAIEHAEYAMKRKKLNKRYNNARDCWVKRTRKNIIYYKKLEDNCPEWKISSDGKKQLIGLFKQFQNGSSTGAPELTDNVKGFLTEKENMDKSLREEYWQMRIKNLKPGDTNNLELAYRECLDDKDKFMQITITSEVSTFVLEGFYQKRRANFTFGRNNSLTQTAFLDQLNSVKILIAQQPAEGHNPKSGKEQQESCEKLQPTGAPVPPTETRKPLIQKHISMDTAEKVEGNEKIIVVCPTEWSYSTQETTSDPLIMTILTQNEYNQHKKERDIIDKQINDNCNEWVANEKKKDGEYKKLLKNYEETRATNLGQDELYFILENDRIHKKIKEVYMNKLYTKINLREWRSLELAYRACSGNEIAFMTTTITSKLSTYVIRAFFEKRKASGRSFPIVEMKNQFGKKQCPNETQSVAEHSVTENKIQASIEKQKTNGEAFSTFEMKQNSVEEHSKTENKTVINPAQWGISSNNLHAHTSLSMQTLSSNDYAKHVEKQESDVLFKQRCHTWVHNNVAKLDEYKELLKKCPEWSTVFKNEQRYLLEGYKQYQKCGKTSSLKLTQNLITFLSGRQKLEETFKNKYLKRVLNDSKNKRILKILELAYRECSGNEDKFLEITVTSKWSTVILRGYYQLRATSDGPIAPASAQSPKTHNEANPASHQTSEEVNKKPSDDGENLGVDLNAEPIKARNFTENIQDGMHSTTSTDHLRFPAISAIPEFGTKSLKRPFNWDMMANEANNDAPQFKRSKIVTHDIQNLDPLKALPVIAKPFNQNNGYNISEYIQLLQSQFYNFKKDRVENEAMEQLAPNSTQGHAFQNLKQSKPMGNVNRFVGGNDYQECIRIEPEPIRINSKSTEE